MTDWVADSVMGFLASPLFSAPISNFIENNCVVFDTEEEHKIEYMLIFKKFKELVEALLEGFLSDLAIEPSSFGEVMTTEFAAGSGAITKEALRWATQTMAAAEDYLLFRSMMTERNLELEAEVHRMMDQASSSSLSSSEPSAQKAAPTGAGPAATGDAPAPAGTAAPATEEEALQHAMRLSMESFAAEQKAREWDEDEIRAAIEASRLEYEALQRRLLEQHQATQRALDDALKESLKTAPKLKARPKPKPPKKQPPLRPTPNATESAQPAAALDAEKKGKLEGLRELPKLRLRLGRALEAATAEQWACEPVTTGDEAGSASATAAAAPETGSSAAGGDDDVGEGAASASAAAAAAPEAASAAAPAAAAGARSEQDERRRFFLEQRDRLRAQKRAARQQEVDAYTYTGEMSRLARPSGEDDGGEGDAGADASAGAGSGQHDKQGVGSDGKGGDKRAGELFREALAARLKHEATKGGTIRSERPKR